MSKLAALRMTSPTRLTMAITGLPETGAHEMAIFAAATARAWAPKLSGRGASTIYPIWGAGWFGISWQADYLWMQEIGIRPFTMGRLAGRVIPMWVDDPDGKTRAANPKAEVRTTASGKTQVKIFRRVSGAGTSRPFRQRAPRKVIPDLATSYAGAPGRVDPATGRSIVIPPRIGGATFREDTGVRWRHPGLDPRGFLHFALYSTARAHGVSGDITPGF